jgi:nucleoside-diphosphate-sugar epimerase
MTDRRIYVVGSRGYIGVPLCRELNANGWEVVEIDAGIYGNIDDKQDVIDMKPPADGCPVIWLATVHREPVGLTPDEQGKWGRKMEDIMVKAPLNWVRAGHPLTYASSMQVVKGGSIYAYCKLSAEQNFVGMPDVSVVRFGTVWGQLLTGDPVRYETAVNSSLLGKKLTENYIAHTCHLELAILALSYAPENFQYGDVHNVCDAWDPITGDDINKILDVPPNRRTPFQAKWAQEWNRFAPVRELEAYVRKHFTKELADFYKLPWPKGLDDMWSKDSPIMQGQKK